MWLEPATGHLCPRHSCGAAGGLHWMCWSCCWRQGWCCATSGAGAQVRARFAQARKLLSCTRSQAAPQHADVGPMPAAAAASAAAVAATVTCASCGWHMPLPTVFAMPSHAPCCTPVAGVSEVGFRFLLRDTYHQLWLLLRQYISFTEKSSGERSGEGWRVGPAGRGWNGLTGVCASAFAAAQHQLACQVGHRRTQQLLAERLLRPVPWPGTLLSTPPPVLQGRSCPPPSASCCSWARRGSARSTLPAFRPWSRRSPRTWRSWACCCPSRQVRRPWLASETGHGQPGAACGMCALPFIHTMPSSAQRPSAAAAAPGGSLWLHPTRLASLLAAKPSGGRSSGEGFIIVETNYRWVRGRWCAYATCCLAPGSLPVENPGPHAAPMQHQRC